MLRRLVGLLAPWLVLVLLVGVASAAVTAGSDALRTRAATPKRAPVRVAPKFTPLRAPVAICRTVRTAKGGRRTTCAPQRCVVTTRRPASKARRGRVSGRATLSRLPARSGRTIVRLCSVKASRPGGRVGFGVISGAGAGTATPVAVPAQPSTVLRIDGGADGRAARIEVRGASPGSSGTTLLRILTDRDGELTLDLARAADVVGPNGGPLSERLRLAVTELDGAVLYEGLVRDLRLTALGRARAGDSRTVRLTLSFPDGGLPPGPTTGDNVFQGSGLELDLRVELRVPSG